MKHDSRKKMLMVIVGTKGSVKWTNTHLKDLVTCVFAGLLKYFVVTDDFAICQLNGPVAGFREIIIMRYRNYCLAKFMGNLPENLKNNFCVFAV